MRLHETGASSRTYAAMAIVACLLQVGIAPQISLFGGTFNFMVVLAVSLALTREVHASVVCGFLCGLFFDLTSAVPVGLMALVLTIGSFAVATMAHGMVAGMTVEGVRLAIASVVVVNIVYAVFLYVLGVQSDLMWALGHGVSGAVLDSLACLPFIAAGGGSAPTRGFTARSGGSRLKGLK